jgi:hypothetical protein
LGRFAVRALFSGNLGSLAPFTGLGARDARGSCNGVREDTHVNAEHLLKPLGGQNIHDRSIGRDLSIAEHDDSVRIRSSYLDVVIRYEDQPSLVRKSAQEMVDFVLET